MDRIRHPRPSASLVISMIALFVALSGTAVALDGSNTVFSDDLVNGEVKSPDLEAAAVTTGALADRAVDTPKLASGAVRTAAVRDNDLKGADVADESLAGDDLATGAVGATELLDDSLTGADIADDSLTGAEIGGLTGADVANGTLGGADFATDRVTGADIDESALGSAAPNATATANAQEVDGVSARSFEYHANNEGVDTVIYRQGGLTLLADCDVDPVAAAHVEVFADSGLDGSYIYAANVNRDRSLEPTVDTSFDRAEPRKQLKASPGFNEFDFGGYGVVAFRGGPAAGTDTSSDDVLTVEYLFSGNGSCDVFGTAIGGAS